MAITKSQNHYSAPEVEVIVTTVEQGFSLSNLENPGEKDPMEW